MSKRFKLKFPSITIPSFHICRPKSPATSFPKNPKSTANYRRSPVDASTAVEISFPTATPEYTYVSRRASSVRKVRSSSDGREFPRRTVETTTSRKSIVKENKKNKNKKKNVPARSSHVYTLTDIDGEKGNDDDDDSLVLLDSSRSFSSERFATGETCRRRRSGRTTRESVAVVKKSTNPYEDFKRSMLEMIMEKEMFEAMDLEELLQCFLSLNSRQYHGIIVEAFSEIWDSLFSDSSIAQHRLSF